MRPDMPATPCDIKVQRIAPKQARPVRVAITDSDRNAPFLIFRSMRRFILVPREKRCPSGPQAIATRVAWHASHDPHFSMFAEVLWGGFLVYCMDVQLSISGCSGPAPAGEGQAR